MDQSQQIYEYWAAIAALVAVAVAVVATVATAIGMCNMDTVPLNVYFKLQGV